MPTAKITVALEIERDIRAIAVHPEGKCFATASNFGDVVTLYDFKTGTTIASLTPQTQKVRNSGPAKGTQLLSFSPDGKLLASIGDDDTIWIWDCAERREYHVIRGHKFPIYSIAFSPDGSCLICTCQESALEVWDVKTRKVVSAAKPLEIGQTCIAFLNKGKTVINGDWNGNLNIWDLASEARVAPAR